MWLGTFIGVLMAFVSVFSFYLYMRYGQDMSIVFSDLLLNKHLISPIISLAGIPNLVIFFIFLNKSKYRTARGLILSTFILVLLVVLTKIFL
jgi:hypothetical protein